MYRTYPSIERLRTLLNEMREKNHTLNHRPLEVSLNRFELLIEGLLEEYTEKEEKEHVERR